MQTKKNKKTNFYYKNIDKKIVHGKTIVKKVVIKNGKGIKSVSKYHGSKNLHTIRKPLSKREVNHIHKGIFVHGLFNDCKSNCKDDCKCKIT